MTTICPQIMRCVSGREERGRSLLSDSSMSGDLEGKTQASPVHLLSVDGLKKDPSWSGIDPRPRETVRFNRDVPIPGSLRVNLSDSMRVSLSASVERRVRMMTVHFQTVVMLNEKRKEHKLRQCESVIVICDYLGMFYTK